MGDIFVHRGHTGERRGGAPQAVGTPGIHAVVLLGGRSLPWKRAARYIFVRNCEKNSFSSNLKMCRYDHCCNLFHLKDKSGKAPDLYNIRLVKTLTGEDGIGGGITVEYGERISESQIVATNDSIIVADAKWKQLKVFDHNGVFVKSISGRKDSYGAPMHPDKIVLDCLSRIIVADNELHNVRILDPSGAYIKEFGPDGNEAAFDEIEAVKTTSQDNIIVRCGDEFHLFDSTGKPLDKISIKGELFFGKNHVLERTEEEDDWSSTHKYTCTLYDFTIRNASGHASKISKKDRTKHLLYVGSRHVALDDQDRLYAAGSDSIHVFDPSGNEAKEIQYPKKEIYHEGEEMREEPAMLIRDISYLASSGWRGEEMREEPVMLARSILPPASGWRGEETREEPAMFAPGHGRVVLYHSDGISIWDGEKFHHFDAMQISPYSSVLFASKGGVVVYDGHDHGGIRLSLRRISPPNTVQTLLEIHESHSVPIATDDMNRIIVADHGCVKILNPDGGIVGTIVDADGQGGRFGEIMAVTTDQKNRIAVLDHLDKNEQSGACNHIRIFDSKGRFVESFAEVDAREESSDSIFEEERIPPKRNDNAYKGADKRLVAVLGSYPKLAYDSHGRVVRSVYYEDRGGREPRIDFDKGSYITIEDSRGREIKKIEVAGGHNELIGFADAITVDKWDRIVVVDNHKTTIRIFDHNGSLVKSVRSAEVGGRDSRVGGVAVDSMGRIIVSGSWPEYGGYSNSNINDMIQIFGPVPKDADGAEDPLRILKTRYARGEITDEQFETMKKRLT